MLDQETRGAILRLQAEGHGIRTISRLLRVSKNSVRRVLRSGKPEVPALERETSLTPHLDRIRELHALCGGNRVRVVEMLETDGIRIPYSTLTRFCRSHGIGVREPRRVGRYHFEPGEEMQHDTSPHTVEVAGQRRKLQCASIVLCYSRMLFAQVYPRWSRFEAKVFLTEALKAFDGAARRCMVDNSSIVIARGSGADAAIAPEMEAFAGRFGFHFTAHAVGDANRSARVERPFHFIETNFYAGRRFQSFQDLNTQLRTWCDTVNDRPKRTLGARPREVLAAEKPRLLPLPAFIPEVYEPHSRRADVEGFVSLHANRYSVPTAFIGRRLELRETPQRILVFEGPRCIAEHDRLEPGSHRRVTLPEHQGGTRWKKAPASPLPEETHLRTAAPELAPLVDALRKRHGGQAARAVRRLHRMYMDYPFDVLTRVVVEKALPYGLIDLARIERLVLRHLAGDYFRLPLWRQGKDMEAPQDD
ncbi:MAG: IS21 family transposase [Candidatus Eisenbacteria bacterium]|nr:IS21 family transposase [Candidatus Eisenbacteria bacterium]